MEIKCKNCGKIHNIEDAALMNKKVFFFCSSCNQKVTVDGRKNFTENNVQPKEMLSFLDIFKGFKNGFIPFNIFAGTFFFVFSILYFSVIFIVTKKNSIFFAENKALLISLIFFSIILVYYFFNVSIYLISKTILYKKNNPNSKRINFKIIFFDFSDDSKAIFLLSIVSFFLSALFLLPILFAGNFSLIISPVLIFFSSLSFFAAIVVFLLNGYIMASIASDSFFVFDSIKASFRFIYREFFNIPLYSVIIESIMFFFYSIILSLCLFSFSVSSFSAAFLINPFAKSELFSFFSNIFLKITGQSTSSLSLLTNLSGLIVLMFGFSIFAVILSSIVNVRQALYTEAVFIMKANPSKSIHRAVVLCFVFLVIIFYFLKFDILLFLADKIKSSIVFL